MRDEPRCAVVEEGNGRELMGFKPSSSTVQSKLVAQLELHGAIDNGLTSVGLFGRLGQEVFSYSSCSSNETPSGFLMVLLKAYEEFFT